MKNQLARESMDLTPFGDPTGVASAPRGPGDGHRGRRILEVWVWVWVWAWAWSACAVVAAGLVTTLSLYRTWGFCAAAGCGCAGVAAALRARSRHLPRAPALSARLSVVLAVMGAVVPPFLILVLTDSARFEAAVVERSADLLLDSGSPYISAPPR